MVSPMVWGLPQRVMQNFAEIIIKGKVDNFFSCDRKRIDEGRNLLIERALETGDHWIYLNDSDVIVDTNVINILLKNAYDLDTCIVGAIVNVRGSDIPAAYRYKPGQKYDNEYQANPIILNDVGEVDFIGFSSLLLHRNVFEHLSNPYFEFKSSPQGLIGEDFIFCKRARDAGYKIYGNPNIKHEHLI